MKSTNGIEDMGPGGGPTVSPVTGGGTMMQKMIARKGPVAGKKEFFSTLQKKGKLGKRGAKSIGGKKNFL